MWRDEAYLLDILIAARKVQRFVEGVSAEGFEESLILQDAVVRNLQIIGEAARKISEDLRQQYPEIAWDQIIGMRNRLVHEYFRVDLEKVWETVENDIPVLLVQIQPLVPPEDKV